MVTMDVMKKTKINYTEIFGLYGNNEKVKIVLPLFNNTGFIYDMNYDINCCLGIASNYQFELVETSYNNNYIALNFRKIKPKHESIKKASPIQRRIVNEV